MTATSLANPHIAPVGLGPFHSWLKDINKWMFYWSDSKAQFVFGPKPIPVLAGPGTPELELPSIHSYGYGSRSSPALSRPCPSPAPGILVQYAG